MVDVFMSNLRKVLMRIDRRYFIKGSIALSGAALAGGLVSKTEEPVDIQELSVKALELSTLRDPKDKISEFKEVYDRDPKAMGAMRNFRELADLVVVGDEEEQIRHKYAYNYFMETKSVKPPKGEAIPSNISNKLAQLAPGIIAEESKYHNGAKSEDGAETLWQIQPEFYESKRVSETSDRMGNIKVSTKVAFQKFEHIYYALLNGVEVWKDEKRIYHSPGVDFENFCTYFGMNEEQWENFLSLAMVNAYNTGEGRMLKVLHWFRDNYSQKDLVRITNHSELGLFSLMSDMAQEKSAIKGYGEDSNNYVFKVLGGGESLDGKYTLSFSPIEGVDPEIEPLETMELLASSKTSNILGSIGVGVVGGAVIEHAVNTQQVLSATKCERRDWFERRKAEYFIDEYVASVPERVLAQVDDLCASGILSPERRKFLGEFIALTSASVVGVMAKKKKDQIPKEWLRIPDLPSQEELVKKGKRYYQRFMGK